VVAAVDGGVDGDGVGDVSGAVAIRSDRLKMIWSIGKLVQGRSGCNWSAAGTIDTFDSWGAMRCLNWSTSMKAMKVFLIIGTAVAGLGAASTAGSAMPISQLTSSSDSLQQARTVCDADGRCWNEHRNALSVLGLERRHEYIGRWRRDWHDHDWHDRNRHDHFRRGGDYNGDNGM